MNSPWTGLQRRTCHPMCKVQIHAKSQTPNAIRNKINAAVKMMMVADFWVKGGVDPRVRDEFSFGALIDDAKLSKRGSTVVARSLCGEGSGVGFTSGRVIFRWRGVNKPASISTDMPASSRRATTSASSSIVMVSIGRACRISSISKPPRLRPSWIKRSTAVVNIIRVLS
jgi:hypothetical protein